jgi:hypothetical protein
MPLLPLDFLAGVVTRRIDASPPCISLFVKRFQSFFAPTRGIAKPTRAGAVKAGLTLRRIPPLPGHTLTALSTMARGRVNMPRPRALPADGR